MKDQYVGDISDYFKYAFLWRVHNAGGDTVVCWMLTDADGKSDGSKRNYLKQPGKFRGVDAELFELLTKIDREGAHSVAAVEASGALKGTCFMSAMFPDDRGARNELLWELEKEFPAAWWGGGLL